MKQLSSEMLSQRLSLTPDELQQYLQIEIEDPNGPPMVFNFTNGETGVWAGKTWSNTPFYISGISNSASGEKSRPTLTLPNEEGVYTYYLSKGLFENSLVTRYTAIPGEGYGALVSKHVFYVSHPKQISGTNIALELRRLSDANQYKLPPNRYIQPEFPTVVV